MNSALHHISKRKRFHQKLEEYPSKKFWIRLLDKFLIAIAVIGPLMAIPQLLDVYMNQNADNISFLSWASWSLFNLFWLAYGIVHREKPIIITYILWFIVNAMMALSALIF